MLASIYISGLSLSYDIGKNSNLWWVFEYKLELKSETKPDN